MSLETTSNERPGADEVTLPEAAQLLGRHPGYVRLLVAKERPDGQGKELPSRLWRGVRLIKLAEIEAYRQRKPTRGRKAGYAGLAADEAAEKKRAYQREYMKKYRQGK
jgi:hypothetical protein